MLGIDCSSPITAHGAQILRYNKVDFVIRYILPKSWKSWKAATYAEIDMLLKMGFRVGFVFERDETRTLGGAPNGKEDAELALEALQELGVSARVTVYFAVDSEQHEGSFDAIEAYLREAKVVLQGFDIGVYGSFEVVEGMLDRGCVKYAWQTLAWSHHMVSTRIALYQKTAPVRDYGFDVDKNDSFGDYQGLLLLVDNERMVDEDMGRLDDFEARLKVLESKQRTLCPDWARESVDKAFALGLLRPEADGHVYGDETFWREFVLNDRKGEYDEVVKK